MLAPLINDLPAEPAPGARLVAPARGAGQSATAVRRRAGIVVPAHVVWAESQPRVTIVEHEL